MPVVTMQDMNPPIVLILGLLVMLLTLHITVLIQNIDIQESVTERLDIIESIVLDIDEDVRSLARNIEEEKEETPY
ncbi:MAG: hypothetical protein GDA54_03915 [Alphaproteobacteria bacterium GM7ARS4]|nr:hypothetical protein [Alphaproteobacteria bacterium GM7ARS4]